MDQLPRSRPEAFANDSLFANSSQQFNAYDSQSHAVGHDQSPYDNSWDVNSGGYALPPSRVQAQSPAWAPHGNANHHLHGHVGNVNGQPSPYARPVSQSPGPYGQQGYNGYNAHQNFHYQQSQPQYDPALFQSSHDLGFKYTGADFPNPTTAIIAPHALQHQARPPTYGEARNPQSNQVPQRPSAASSTLVDYAKLVSSIPAGTDAGRFSIIPFDDLKRTTNSERMSSFVNVGREPLNWDCNRAAFPTYTARRSRNELRTLAGNDSRLLAKIGKKSTKMHRIATAPRPGQTVSNVSALPSEKIKHEGDSSSDESSSEDDDDASSTSDDDAEPTPLPAKRPESATGGTEYDTIKALWRPKRKTLGSDSIRKGLVDFWEIAKTIRDRWKADATAFEEAKKKGQKSQLPLLESRVKDGRDTIEAAFKAALKHGHRSIVEIMSENESLIYLCYQFLLDRFKAEDYNSALPRTMLELITIWTSLTEERIEKTHIGKVLVRYAKYGDAKTKYYVNKITSNAAVASKQVKEKAASAQDKKPPANGAKTDSPTQRPAEPVAGVKRAASTAAGEGNAAKKVATGSTKAGSDTTTARPNGAVKKASAASDAGKTATGPPVVTKTKSVTAKPSGIFSSLSAAKKPGTSTATKPGTTAVSTASKLVEKKASTAAPKSTFSFAETMANLSKPKEEKPVAQPKPEKRLPPETAEERTKRLRKESRRHLRVSFKREDELTEVRYFTHDPDEELGHDASQMRDVSDVGGEGRMFKQQHQMMDIDEDEDAAEEEEKALVAFKEPGLIDFSEVDHEERARNYTHRGGKLEVDSKERANRDYYDANNLIVFYTTPEDIPPDPREPSNPYSGDAVENARDFASPEEKYAARARQRKGVQHPHYGGQQHHQHQSAPQPPSFDLSALAGLANQQPHMQQSQPPAPPSNIDSILASLKAANPNANMPTPPPPQVASFPGFPPQPPMMPGIQPSQQPQQPPQIPGNVDLASLLQQLRKNNPAGGTAPPPAMGGFGMPPAPAMNFGQSFADAQSQWQQQQGVAQGGLNRGENRMTAEMRANPITNKKYKTKVCQFWQKGTCQKGDDCSYKHSDD